MVNTNFLYLNFTKAITYVHGLKMKRDASVKVVFLGRKKTTFMEASLFIFGPSSYVTVLVTSFNNSDKIYYTFIPTL